MTLPTTAFSEQELVLARARLIDGNARDVIAWALTRFSRQRRVVVTGLQAEGVAVADMAIALDPAVRVLTIDTGRLPEATHRYLDTLREHWARTIEVIHPDRDALEGFTREHGANPFYASAQLRLDCCHLRKVAPLQRVLAAVDCWLSGVRRGQAAGRAGAEMLEIDARHGGIIKVNPLARWSDENVQGYLRAHGVPLHPLYSTGYASIGCAPCTRPVAAGEHARAGRWWWETGVEKECGIHATPLLAPVGAAS
jgi:phosphoadenylyl-sulfate reductase (thioredoxin)